MIDQSNADYEFSYAVFHKRNLKKQLFFFLLIFGRQIYVKDSLRLFCNNLCPLFKEVNFTMVNIFQVNEKMT